MSGDRTLLRGLRVVDLADQLGIYATRMLAQLEAEVIRVEPPEGDPLRLRPPFLGDVEGPDRSLWWAYMNARKKSVTLDLDSADGRSALKGLAATSDVIFFSGPSQRFDKLGLSGLRRELPEAVVTVLTPFGLTGPRRSWRGSDLTAWAASGLLYTIGDPDRPPVAPGGELACILGGQFALVATLAAVRTRRQAGRGNLVDVSLQEAVAAASGESGVSVFLDDLIPRARTGNRRRTCAPFGLFEASDGYVSILAIMPQHWAAMREWIYEHTENDAVLDPALEGGPQSRAGDVWDVVNLFTEDLTRRFPKQELFEEGQRRGVPIAPVNDAEAVAGDPQLLERRFWVEVEINGRRVRAPGMPFRFAGRSWPGSMRAPQVGEHNDEAFGASSRELEPTTDPTTTP